MKKQKFSEAMTEIDDRYILEASAVQSSPKISAFRRLPRAAARICAGILIATLSFGTALAISPDFRQAVISFFFPLYMQNELHEIDEGHRTGSFDRDDTLLTFLENFNKERPEENITVKKENGFEYTTLIQNDHSVMIIVECSTPNDKLLVVMERKPYKETSGLWQVIAYQVIDRQTANDLIAAGHESDFSSGR